MTTQLQKTLSVFTDVELFEISEKLFGFRDTLRISAVNRIDAACWLGLLNLDNLLKEYNKTLC